MRFAAKFSPVAAETTLRTLMPDVLGIGVPPDFHFGKDVDRVNVAECAGSRANGICAVLRNVGMVLAVLGHELRRYGCAGFFMRGELSVDNTDGLTLDEGEFAVDRAVA